MPAQRASIFETSLLIAALVAPAPLLADDWPQFRGPNRDGISAETGLATSWPETGPAELWRTDLGAAFSAIVVVGDELYTADSDDEGQYALKLDAATGAELWRQKISGPHEDSWGDGPRSTPTVAGDLVYFLSGDGVLSARDRSTGEVRWSVDFKERFEVEPPRWGFSAAPLVLGDRLFVETGASDGRSIVALDRASGEVAWNVGSSSQAYSSPIHLEFGGQHQLVFLNAENVLSVDLDGQELWRHEFSPGDGVKPAMPIFAPPDLIFVSASYDIGALAVRMTNGGGALGAEEVWRSRVMRNHFNSSVLVDGHLYGFDNATFKCIDAATGEQRWAKRGRLGKGSLIYADGHLVVLSETGRLLLVEADPEAYVEKASADVLSGRCWTSPTLSGGRLYLRNLEEMVALDLRELAADPRVAEIVARHIEALGGSEALAAARTFKMTGTLSLNGVDSPLTIYRKRPDRYRIEVDLGGQVVVSASAGDVAWRQGGGRDPGPQAMDADSARRFFEEYGDFDGALIGYQAEGTRVELVGEEEIDGTDTYHLRLTLASGNVQDWYLSQADALVVKKITRQVHRRRGEYERLWYPMEYVPAGGVAIPRYVEREDRQFVRAFAIGSVEVNVELDDALFEMPAGEENG